MKYALFESLTGKFADGTDLDSLDSNQRLMQSVIDNLMRIFNTRKGSLTHLKEYGLPDISDIYSKIPHSIDDLKDAIKKTIELYEPRMKNIRVQPKNMSESEKMGGKSMFRLEFVLTGELKGLGMVRLTTTFFPSGFSKIAAFKRQT